MVVIVHSNKMQRVIKEYKETFKDCLRYNGKENFTFVNKDSHSCLSFIIPQSTIKGQRTHFMIIDKDCDKETIEEVLKPMCNLGFPPIVMDFTEMK